MRIDERSLSEQVSSAAARSNETQRVQVGGNNASGTAGAAGDQVHLSGLTGRISGALATASKQAAQRVSHLQQQYRAGNYQPDARAVSRAMVGTSRS